VFLRQLVGRVEGEGRLIALLGFVPVVLALMDQTEVVMDLRVMGFQGQRLVEFLKGLVELPVQEIELAQFDDVVPLLFRGRRILLFLVGRRHDGMDQRFFRTSRSAFLPMITRMSPSFTSSSAAGAMLISSLKSVSPPSVRKGTFFLMAMTLTPYLARNSRDFMVFPVKSLGETISMML